MARDIRLALAVYERTLKPTIRRQQAAARRMARWFVPTSESRVWMRNVVTRASVLPPVAAVLRRAATHGRGQRCVALTMPSAPTE